MSIVSENEIKDKKKERSLINYGGRSYLIEIVVFFLFVLFSVICEKCDTKSVKVLKV